MCFKEGRNFFRPFCLLSKGEKNIWKSFYLKRKYKKVVNFIMNYEEIPQQVAPYKSDLFKLLKAIKNEFVNLFEIKISKYIDDRKDKLSSINTFLTQNEKVPFYDVFFPLILFRKHEKIESNQTNLDILFEATNTIGIFGVAGSGKTMLMRHIFLTCYNSTFKIPIFVELRLLNKYTGTLTEYIYSIILDNKIKPSSQILERALETGKFIFILDGFDEVVFDKREKLTTEIEFFTDRYNENYFIISSRHGTSIETIPRLVPMSIKSLELSEILDFIKIQGKFLQDEELTNKIRELVLDKKNEYLQNYLENPLLLSMFILTYRNNPELPRSKNKFYWNVFDTLGIKHDSLKKGAFVHPRKTNLLLEDFENILKAFCYISLEEYEFNFDRKYLKEKLSFIRNKYNYKYQTDDVIYDLVTSISIMIPDGIQYKFPHRTLQDYFSVLFIKEQTDNVKKIIYRSKLQNVLLAPSANQNFYDLCLELDKQAFYNYFIIEQIDLFISNYGTKDKFKEFFEIIDLKFVNNFREWDLTWESCVLRRKTNTQIGLALWLDIDFDEYILGDSRKEEQKIFNSLKAKDLLEQKNIYNIKRKFGSRLISYEVNVKNLEGDKLDLIFNILGLEKKMTSFMDAVLKKSRQLKCELTELQEKNKSIWNVDHKEGSN